MEDFRYASGDAWLVYDGLCPLCDNYAHMVRLRQSVGSLHLVDARYPSALLDEITAAGLDIDQGMVLKFNDVIYYGSDAVHMLTMLGSSSGLFNRICKLTFGSQAGARVFYPIAKAVRNAVLKLIGVPYIDNLHRHKQAAPTHHRD